MIYTKTSLVSASMCAAKATLSPLAAFQLVEDAVTELLGDSILMGYCYARVWRDMGVRKDGYPILSTSELVGRIGHT